MARLEDAKKAVSRLPPKELTRFRAWFQEFDAALVEEKAEPDAQGRKPEGLAAAAVAGFKKGRVRGL